MVRANVLLFLFYVVGDIYDNATNAATPPAAVYSFQLHPSLSACECVCVLIRDINANGFSYQDQVLT